MRVKKDYVCAGEELLMGYKIGFWNGIHRAQKWRDENQKASAMLAGGRDPPVRPVAHH